MASRLYFGHPINTYGTELETRLLEILLVKFPGRQIVNPGAPEHQAVCERMLAEGGEPMSYFLGEVVPDCSVGVFLPFLDGWFGAGVHKEALLLESLGRPVWGIRPDGEVRQIFPAGMKPLTVDETHDRIRDASGATIPY